MSGSRFFLRPFYVLSTSFLRLFYVIGIMRYRNCILCIFFQQSTIADPKATKADSLYICKKSTTFAGK